MRKGWLQVSREEKRLYFELNTPITAFPGGDFEEKTHQTLVQRVYARIKYNDGITRCFVSQYGIEVKYFSDVTDASNVRGIVEEAVDWATAELEDLFPLRGSKTPTATLSEGHKPDPNAPQRVFVRFSSHLTPYYPNGDGGFDTAMYRKKVQPLAETLTNFNGVTEKYELGRNGAVLYFDPRIMNRPMVVAHMRAVFTTAAQGDEFFPYLGENVLEMNFED